MPTLLLYQNPKYVDQADIDTIKSLAKGYDLWITKKPVEEDPARIADIEICAGGEPPKEIVLSPNLKWHHQFSAGVDWIFEYDNYLDWPWQLTNSSGIHAVPITEHTFAMLLAFERQLPLFIQNQEKARWVEPSAQHPMGQINGKTMLILGAGTIGKQMAKVAKAHDMQVLGIRRQANIQADNFDSIGDRTQLNEFIAEADYIIGLLPKTPDTQDFVSREQFDLMKPSAVVVNLGRGIHFNEEAMIQALQSKQIRGACLDTFITEPLPKSSRLWQLDNVLISPHLAGGQPDYGGAARESFIQNLKRWVAEEPLKNLVDKKLGYSLSH